MLPAEIVEDILEHSASPYKNYCTGYHGTGGYIVAAVMGIGSFRDPCGHSGFSLVDSIRAFDLTESSEAYIGQINMSTVSSFCGLEGLIWGLDVARTKAPSPHPLAGVDGMDEFAGLRIHAGSDLRRASMALFGTAAKRRYPMLPGCHVPCASKFATVRGPAHLYAAFAVGVPEDRRTAACLLMEDVGELAHGLDTGGIAEASAHILKDMLRSVRAIGRNHSADYREVHIDFMEKRLDEDEVGCSLVAMPYILLAQGAYNRNIARQSLEEWEKGLGKLSV